MICHISLGMAKTGLFFAFFLSHVNSWIENTILTEWNDRNIKGSLQTVCVILLVFFKVLLILSWFMNLITLSIHFKILLHY